MFSKVLIANRGDVALRVIRACRELGISTVAIHSTADADGPWLEWADQKVCIGGGPASESYLRVERIISAAELTKSDAIHPGYGFLSENAAFSRQCAEQGVVFIGPPAGAIEVMGSKSAAKQKFSKRRGGP